MKKLSFFLMAMLISLVSFAEEATLSFADKAQRTSFSSTQQVWEQDGITFTNDKASSGNNVADYANPVRLYQGSTITVECGKGNITKIVFATNASKYVTPMQNSLGSSLGTVAVSGNNVTLTLSTPAASINAIALTAQVRLNSITVTYEKVQSTEPTITCGNVSFGIVKAGATSTKELVVEAENLTEAITATFETGTAFSVTGDLTTTGGTLTLAVIATEEGTYNDVLTLTSGTATKTVEVSANVIRCQGEGTEEKPYLTADVIKLANSGEVAWVEGYIIGVMNNNELVTSNIETNSNIVIANTVEDTVTYVPVAIPTAIRAEINLVDNPTNLGKKIAVKGKLDAYFSMPGVKETSEYKWAVTKYTITATAENGTVEGAGEYEEGKEATLTATAAEGYEFVNWTVDGAEVSTENPYTFVVTANVALVANFEKAEPELEVMDIEMTNLVVQEMEGFLVLTASDDDNTGLNVMLALNADGTLNTEVSYMALLQGWNEIELPIVEGEITKTFNEELATDVYTGLIVVEYMEGKLGLNLTMYAKPVVVTDVVVTDATITVETGDDGMGGTYEMINVTANWNESVLKLEGVEKEFEGFLQITETFVVDGEEDWYIWMCMNGVITTVDNVLTVTGEFKNNFTGDVYNVTISGTLPVEEEPEVIEYVLDGGEFPAVVVPTNAELWEAFKPYYNTYYGLTRADQPIDKVSTFAAAKMQEIMTDEASEYKWLGDYVLNVAAGQGVNLPTDMAAANEGAWRWAVHAFFNATTGANGAAGTDFTEAGKPEAWGAAYEAEYGVVLPTEPVVEDYVLPTPTKEGYTFVGWYDNAEGTGEPYKVIPAGWTGTLYAIWKANSPTTNIDNITIENKATKAIINGQLVIIKNGVQYNVQGAILK